MESFTPSGPVGLQSVLSYLDTLGIQLLVKWMDGMPEKVGKEPSGIQFFHSDNKLSYS